MALGEMDRVGTAGGQSGDARASARLRSSWMGRIPTGAWVFIFFLSLYGATAPGHVSMDGLSRLAVGISIAEWREVTLTGGLHYYWATLQALVFVPLYLLGKAAAPFVGWQQDWVVNFVASFVSVPFGAANATLVYLLAKRMGYRRRTAIELAAVYGTGTIAWEYGRSAFDVAQETFFLLLSVLLLVDGISKRRTGLLIAAGVALGAGVMTRNNVVIAVPALMAYTLMRLSAERGFWSGVRAALATSMAFAAGFVPMGLAVAWFNFARFGTPFSNGAGTLWASRVGVATEVIPAFLSGVRDPTNLFQASPVEGLYGLLLSPGRGLVPYEPVVLLCLLGLLAMGWKRPAFTILAVSLFSTYLLFYSLYDYWSTAARGPRLLSATLPFLILAMGELIERVRAGGLLLWRWIIAVFVAVSVLIQVGGTLVPLTRHVYAVAAWQQSSGEAVDAAGDPRFAPVVRQWGDLPRMVLNTFQRQPQSQFTFHNSPSWSFQMTLERAMEPNLIPQWWAWIWAAGMPGRWVALAFALTLAPGLVAAWALLARTKLCKRW